MSVADGDGLVEQRAVLPKKKSNTDSPARIALEAQLAFIQDCKEWQCPSCGISREQGASKSHV